MLRQHAEDLNSGPLSKLSVLIRERQHLRKTYNEQWQQLQQELTKVGVHPEEDSHNQELHKNAWGSGSHWPQAWFQDGLSDCAAAAASSFSPPAQANLLQGLLRHPSVHEQSVEAQNG